MLKFENRNILKGGELQGWDYLRNEWDVGFDISSCFVFIQSIHNNTTVLISILVMPFYSGINNLIMDAAFMAVSLGRDKKCNSKPSTA